MLIAYSISFKSSAACKNAMVSGLDHLPVFTGLFFAYSIGCLSFFSLVVSESLTRPVSHWPQDEIHQIHHQKTKKLTCIIFNNDYDNDSLSIVVFQASL